MPGLGHVQYMLAANMIEAPIFLLLFILTKLTFLTFIFGGQLGSVRLYSVLVSVLPVKENCPSKS